MDDRIGKTIRAAHPEIGFVVLSQFVEEDYAFDLLKDGAAGPGYLLKERVAAVTTVHEDASTTSMAPRPHRLASALVGVPRLRPADTEHPPPIR